MMLKNEGTKCSNIIKQKTQDHKTNWRQILGHPYRILITRGSGSGKTNKLLNLIHHQEKDNNIVDKIFFLRL